MSPSFLELNEPEVQSAKFKVFTCTSRDGKLPKFVNKWAGTFNSNWGKAYKPTTK
jgi:hypothetical protein